MAAGRIRRCRPRRRSRTEEPPRRDHPPSFAYDRVILSQNVAGLPRESQRPDRRDRGLRECHRRSAMPSSTRSWCQQNRPGAMKKTQSVLVGLIGSGSWAAKAIRNARMPRPASSTAGSAGEEMASRTSRKRSRAEAARSLGFACRSTGDCGRRGRRSSVDLVGQHDTEYAAQADPRSPRSAAGKAVYCVEAARPRPAAEAQGEGRGGREKAGTKTASRLQLSQKPDGDAGAGDCGERPRSARGELSGNTKTSYMTDCASAPFTWRLGRKGRATVCVRISAPFSSRSPRFVAGRSPSWSGRPRRWSVSGRRGGARARKKTEECWSMTKRAPLGDVRERSDRILERARSRPGEEDAARLEVNGSKARSSSIMR